MQILNPRDKFLSNYEVMRHLEEIKARNNWVFLAADDTPHSRRRARATAGGLDLETVTRDVTSYLAQTACAEVKLETAFVELVQYLNQYDLVKIEKLQIVNLLPRTMVALYAVVEEADQRFDEATCEAMLAKIAELFPVAGDAPQDEGGAPDVLMEQ
jgi:hypothetical protein